MISFWSLMDSLIAYIFIRLALIGLSMSFLCETVVTLVDSVHLLMACFCGLIVWLLVLVQSLIEKNWMVVPELHSANQSVAVKSELLMGFWLSLLMHLASFMSIWHHTAKQTQLEKSISRLWQNWANCPFGKFFFSKIYWKTLGFFPFSSSVNEAWQRCLKQL